jgi:DNA primase
MGYQPIRLRAIDPDERMQIFGSSQISLCSSAGAVARNFLLEREIDTMTMADFRLGYVPLSIDHAFSGRVVMPIFDAYSNLLALSVRPATNDKHILEEFGPKYWNESYEKGQHLFGLNLAKHWIIRWRFAIIVEGQMDVIAMHSFGLRNTIGVLGGAFTPAQAMLLKKWTSQIVVMFDGDAAGKKHTERCMEILDYYAARSQGGLGLGVLKYAAVTLDDVEEADAKNPGKKIVIKDPNDHLCRYGSYSMRQAIAERATACKLVLPQNWLKAGK